MSYIFPYSLCGLSTSLSLWYATDKPIFFPICLIAAAGMGWIKDLNTKQNNPQNGWFSFGMKAIAMYVFGPMLAIGTGFGILMIAGKK